MTAAERGFLLLTSHLGNPERKPLTDAQLRMLTQRMFQASRSTEERDLCPEDLVALGYAKEMAQRIVDLLNEEQSLQWYLRQGKLAGCVPLTRVSDNYPVLARQRLGGESVGCLWAKGNLDLLNYRAISLVGSREINPENQKFAEEVGKQTAMQGFVLISGNARGADRAAQDACLANGGAVISVVADELSDKLPNDRMLYLSEDEFDSPFSPQRALHRNHMIHAMGEKLFVAQATLRSGGTWDGTAKNLRFGWSPVYCFRDGSEAAETLIQMGAEPVERSELCDFEKLPQAITFFSK